jgi:RNA polymerase sigma factor (TIGR02999 family)
MTDDGEGAGLDIDRTADALVPVFYRDLRRIARHARFRVSAGATVQTTALVHEAYLKLRTSPGFADRGHFLRSAALAMRHVLVNLARDAQADKRGGGAGAEPLDDEDERLSLDAGDAQRLLEVDEAMQRLRAHHARLADVVECRFFAGFSEEETAAALGLSDRTVRRDWIKARALLREEIDQ